MAEDGASLSSGSLTLVLSTGLKFPLTQVIIIEFVVFVVGLDLITAVFGCLYVGMYFEFIHSSLLHLAPVYQLAF